MIPSQSFEQNSPRSVQFMLPSTVNEVYDNQQQLLSSRLQISIDGIDLMELYCELDFDSDVESVVTDSSDDCDGDDSSCCSVKNDDIDGRHVDYFRQLPKVLRTHSQQQTWPLFDQSIHANRNRYHDDCYDESASVKSYDSLEDAKKRGILEWSNDRHSTHQSIADEYDPSLQLLPEQRQYNTVSDAQSPGGVWVFDSDEESDYEESDYSIHLK